MRNYQEEVVNHKTAEDSCSIFTADINCGENIAKRDLVILIQPSSILVRHVIVGDVENRKLETTVFFEKYAYLEFLRLRFENLFS